MILGIIIKEIIRFIILLMIYLWIVRFIKYHELIGVGIIISIFVLLFSPNGAVRVLELGGKLCILKFFTQTICPYCFRKIKKVKVGNLIENELKRLHKEISNISSHEALKKDFSQVDEVMIKIDEQVDFMQKEKEIMDILFSTPNKIEETFDTDKLDELLKGINHLRNIPEISRLYDLISRTRNQINNFNEFVKEAYEYINKMYYSSRTGVIGEKRLDEELLLYKDVIKNLGSIRLEVEDTTVESDSIVISENGIFCIEVKNYGDNMNSGKIVISKDGGWKRYSSSGNEIPINNVTSQIYRHIGIQQRFLNEELKKIHGEDIPYVYFKPIIVIANDHIEIENHSDIPVLRISNVYHYITNHKTEEKLHKKYWYSIEKILTDNNKGLKPYPVKHYTPNVFEAFEGLTNISIEAKKIYSSIKEIVDISNNKRFKFILAHKFRNKQSVNSLLGQGKYKEAFETISKKPKKIFKEKWLGYFFMGKCLIYLNKPEEAIHYFKKSYENGGSKSIVHGHIGFCYFKLGKYEDAMLSYNKYYELEDNEIEKKTTINIHMAQSLEKLGRYKEAFEKYSIACNTFMDTKEYSIGDKLFINMMKIKAIKGYKRRMNDNSNKEEMVYERVC